MLECVVNISEGRNIALLAGLAEALSGHLLDVHTDTDHNRSVFTLVGEEAPRLLTRLVVERLSLDDHEGVHPRLGVVDVVPFVPLFGATFTEAERARGDYARWVADELSIPVFSYGTHRTLPFVRAHAWRDLEPDFGPAAPHPTAGAVCVGAREPLVAYNVWLRDTPVEVTRAIAREVRTAHIRTLGLQVGEYTQVSMNLVDLSVAGPRDAFDAVRAECGGAVSHAELVGLVPQRVLESIPQGRWEELDLSADRTIEARIGALGMSAG
ncbi:MAG: hypothetical protein EBS32_10010 [Actinobacteria bacterium]|nr:hypothetical protein [Actinomycetota bacterium]